MAYMATLALKSGLCFLRFCLNCLLLYILFILRAGFNLSNLSSFWGAAHTGVLPDAPQVVLRLAAAAHLPPWRFGVPHYATASVVQVRWRGPGGSLQAHNDEAVEYAADLRR